MSRRALANMERQQQSRRIGRFGRSAMLLIATVLSFSAVGLLLADQLYRPDTFVIDQLQIKGSFVHLDPADIETAVRQMDVGNFFSVDLDYIKTEIEKLQWVQSIRVRRVWPNTLAMQVQEHRPVMRWDNNRWLNSVGQVISLPAGVGPDNAIVLSGQQRDAGKMLQTARHWQQQLDSVGLSLQKLRLSASQAWQITVLEHATKQPFDILLGRDDADQRLARFQYLYQHQLLQAGQQLQRVDVRYPDGLAVYATPLPTEIALAVQEFPEQYSSNTQ